MRRALLALGLALGAAATGGGAGAQPDTYNGVPLRHGIAMHGDVEYGPGFEHFAYANPDAPHGGTIKLAAEGTYDSFNPFIVQGVPVQGARLMHDTLMASSDDEPFSEYGLIAEGIYVPEDRSWVAFKLREDARFHDGEPIEVEDVVFSFKTLRDEGRPFYRFYYKNVADVRRAGPRTVRFDFKGGTNRELPLILGQLPILPKHHWRDRAFGESTLTPPVGSGPYRVADHEPGRYVVYEKVADYWGEDVPANGGRWNFRRIRYDYFRDATVIRTAVTGGDIDLRVENQAKAWATAYDTPAVQSGRLKTVEIDHDRSTGMQGFAMNTRRAPFDDTRVRKAMSLAFDFAWTNKNLFYGQYERTRSYFSNSELAARGELDGREREILAPYRDKVPDAVFETVYQPPTTDGDGYPRENLKAALDLLNEAGWVVRDMKLVNEATGERFRFEILLVNSSFERIVLPYVANLEKLGMDVRVRVVDSSQYQNRVDGRDFDMIVANWGQSLSPGNEQRGFWGCAAAKREGTRNYTGVCDPVVDELIGKLIAAPNREELVARVRALDRVLLWKHLVVPQWHIGRFRVAYWDKFGRPESNPPYGLPYLDTWWVDPERAETIERAQKSADVAGPGRDHGGTRAWLWTAAGLAVLLTVAAYLFRRARGGGGGRA